MSERSNRDYQILFRRVVPTATEKKFFVPVPDTGISIKPPIDMMFTIDKSLTSTPNKLEMTLYNLSPQTRADLQRDGVVVQFSVGYDGAPRRAFIGDVQYANSEHKGTEWKTEIHVADGGRAFAFARVDPKSFNAGTKIVDVLRYVASQAQLVLPKEIVNSAAANAQLPAGWSGAGKLRDELTRLLAPLGYGWSIQEGKLVVLKDEQTLPGTVREVSPKTGMIESPEFGKPEAKGKPPKRTTEIEIYPELQPGEVVNVISRDLEGLHKIVKLRHTGATNTDDWKTQLEIQPTR